VPNPHVLFSFISAKSFCLRLISLIHIRHHNGWNRCWSICETRTTTVSGAGRSTFRLKNWRPIAPASQKRITTDAGASTWRFWRTTDIIVRCSASRDDSPTPTRGPVHHGGRAEETLARDWDCWNRHLEKATILEETPRSNTPMLSTSQTFVPDHR
jgi:hypothetical protein